MVNGLLDLLAGLLDFLGDILQQFLAFRIVFHFIVGKPAAGDQRQQDDQFDETHDHAVGVRSLFALFNAFDHGACADGVVTAFGGTIGDAVFLDDAIRAYGLAADRATRDGGDIWMIQADAAIIDFRHDISPFLWMEIWGNRY